MQTDSVIYFLFPHLAVSEMELRNFYFSLPHLNLFELTQPAAIPEWGRGKFHGLPAVPDSGFRAAIASCVREYHAFAELHGGAGGTLGYLTQLIDSAGESRLEIQEQLRGKGPKGPDPDRLGLLKAAVFLEIARELDEKERELDASYARLNVLEEEFRDILGITPDEKLPEAEETLSPPLLPDSAGRQFMLARRMECWLQLFATQNISGMPVFVTSDSRVLEEALEIVRAACERTGKNFAAARFPLGSLPRVDRLGRKQFQSLIEAPGNPALLSSCWESLDGFIRLAGQSGDPRELTAGSESLRHRLDTLCKNCELPRQDLTTLLLVSSDTLRLGDLLDAFRIGRQAVSGDLPFSFLCVE